MCHYENYKLPPTSNPEIRYKHDEVELPYCTKLTWHINNGNWKNSH